MNTTKDIKKIPVIDRLHRLFKIPYKLSYKTFGRKGPTVILLHGIAVTSESWSNLLDLFDDDFNVIAIDLLGFGDSPKPQNINYNLTDHARSIHSTIRRIGIKKPYIIIGHSMGSLIAIHYTKLYRKEVKRLVLCSPPIYYADRGDSDALMSNWLKRSNNIYMKAYETLRTNQGLTFASAKAISSISLNRINFDLDQATWYSFCQSLKYSIENQTSIKELGLIKIKIDIIYGKLDGFLITSNIKSLIRVNPQITYTSISAGHSITKSYAKTIMKIINNR